MLYEYLQENYKEAEPIFFSDIEVCQVTRSAVNQQLKKLCSEGKLKKYENGVYYMPKRSRLKSAVGINADKKNIAVCSDPQHNEKRHRLVYQKISCCCFQILL